MRLRPLRVLYVAFDRATPWIAGTELVAGLVMSGLYACDVFDTGDRIDLKLAAVAAWFVFAQEGFDMGRDHVLDKAEDAGVDGAGR